MNLKLLFKIQISSSESESAFRVGRSGGTGPDSDLEGTPEASRLRIGFGLGELQVELDLEFETESNLS